jgi:hypothetical protein
MGGTSFRQGGRSLANLAGLDVSAKQVERVVRRIGAERTAQRDAAVEAFLALPLVEKAKAPPGVAPPDVAVVMADGGRVQILNRDTASDAARPAAPVDPAVTAAEAARATPEDGPMPPSPDRAAAAPADGGVPRPSLPAADDDNDRPVAEPGSRSKHWREDKVGLLLQMSSPCSQADPCPDIPAHFIDPKRIEKLTRELKAKARGKVPASAEPKPADAAAAVASAGPQPAQGQPTADADATWDPPTLKGRKVVASRRSWPCFGPMLAAAAWSLGFFAAARRAFLGDGSSAVWGVWRRYFSSYEPILDFIHALSYVYAAAMAGRLPAEGWEVYKSWITWVWQGRVAAVIEAIRQRLAEVGGPQPAGPEGSVARVLQEALTFLENHQGKMKYNAYRQRGLPITTSHIESEIKRINQRVKGTEKFWSEDGAEAILQLRADYLSDDQPMDAFWENRQATETGQRPYRKRS